jgi:hypothetical protein
MSGLPAIEEVNDPICAEEIEKWMRKHLQKPIREQRPSPMNPPRSPYCHVDQSMTSCQSSVEFHRCATEAEPEFNHQMVSNQRKGRIISGRLLKGPIQIWIGPFKIEPAQGPENSASIRL